MRRIVTVTVGVIGVLGLCAPSVGALDPTTERTSDAATLEAAAGRLRVRGTGKWTSDVQRLRVGAQFRELNRTPYFVDVEGQFDYERRLPYDLVHLGGHLGVGRALTETTDVVLKYRLDNYNVYHTGANVDPVFSSVKGSSQVTALRLEVVHDTRDDHAFPRRGIKSVVGGELALEGLGGDYNFGRLEGGVALYGQPFRAHPTGTIIDDLVLVERAKLGWVAGFGGTDDVPFFERYFVGGSTTVRGHRSRWLTPRGLEQQFVGGEILVLNNVEARLPIFKDTFHDRLSVATFFDVGRSYRRFSEIGDFGYGLGAGVRYVVKVWKAHGVLRVDYGLNVGREDDDSLGNLHLTFGVPF